jgi:hypothetical protein
MPSHTPGIDQRLDEVVLKCLERDPLRRWKSAGDLRLALEAATTLQKETGGNWAHERPSASDRATRGRGIHVGPDGITIGDFMGGGHDQVPAEDRTATGPVGEASLFHRGMWLLVIACLLVVWQHFTGNGDEPGSVRMADVCGTCAILMAAGGISLLTRSGVAFAVIAGIAAIVTVPWIWHQHVLLGICAVVIYIAILPKIFSMPRLWRHYYAGTTAIGRLLRMPISLLLFLGMLAGIGLVHRMHDTKEPFSINFDLFYKPSPNMSEGGPRIQPHVADPHIPANPQYFGDFSRVITQTKHGVETINPVAHWEQSQWPSELNFTISLRARWQDVEGEAYFEVCTHCDDGRKIISRLSANQSAQANSLRLSSNDWKSFLLLANNDADAKPVKIASVDLSLVMPGSGEVTVALPKAITTGHLSAWGQQQRQP